MTTLTKKNETQSNPKLTTGNKIMTTSTETETKVTPYDMCAKMHDKGMEEDAIISALSEHAGLSIIKAVRAYENFKKKAGLVESKEDRTKRVHEVIEDHVVMGEGDEPSTINVADAVTAVQDALDIGPQSARKHVKAYAKENDIVLPEIVRSVPATDEQNTFMVESRKGGATKADTLEAFAKQYPDVTANRAKNIYTKASKDAGLTTSVATYTMEEIAVWAKANTFEKDAELLAAFRTKFSEYSEHYSKKMVHMIRFAHIYCDA